MATAVRPAPARVPSADAAPVSSDATTVAVDGTAPQDARLAAILTSDLAFLDWTHPEWRARAAAWARDEARLAGGDHVLRELVPWTGEDGTSYRARLMQAKYLNFAQMHAGVLSGHLERARPVPGKGLSFGPLGEVRSRSAQQGQPTLAETFWYGADGVGRAATAFPAVAAGAQKRACATGHRWTLVEMPALADVRRTQRRAYRPGDRPDGLDVAAGFRPYLVEYSPRVVPYWELSRGVLQCAIVRIPVTMEDDPDRGDDATRGVGTRGAQLGYYVFTRRGFSGFGDAFSFGGWFLFNAARELVQEGGAPMFGTWDACDGEIPLFPLIAATDEAALELPLGVAGEASGRLGTVAEREIDGDAVSLYRRLHGTSYADGAWRPIDTFTTAAVHPMSRSLTMELGQLGVNLMNRMSERDANYSAACKSITYILGTDPADPAKFNLTVQSVASGAIIAPVPAWVNGEGEKQTVQMPQLWNSSEALVDANAGTVIVTSTLAEAREIMVRQLTSDAAQSGASKRVEFATGASPLLAHMLVHRATWEQNVLYFLCRRAGAPHATAWSATSEWPREIELRPVVDDIDAMLGTLDLSGLQSATLVVDLVLQAAKERGLIAPHDEAKIRAELQTSVGRTPTGAAGALATALAKNPNSPGNLVASNAAPARVTGAAGDAQVAAAGNV